MDMLDDLQNQFLRNLLATPRSCPIPALMWETGTISMENKIIKKKLLFYHHLTHLPHDSLAWEVADIQTRLALPGLLAECEELALTMGLTTPSTCSKFQWKKKVNEKILIKNRSDLLQKVEKGEYKKINLDELKSEVFELKPYMTKLNMHSARTKFALRTHMTKSVKLNFKNDPGNKKTLWKCNDCSSMDSQEHILWCPAYGHLREDKNLDSDKDLTRYFQQVLLLRDD